MKRILIGAGLVVGGMSGVLGLSGTNIGWIVSVYGLLVIISGTVQEFVSGRWSPARPEPRQPESELEEWISSELGRLHKPDNLIAQVCQRSGKNWSDAKALIERVQTRNCDAIQRNRRLIALTISVPALIGGVVLMLGSAYAYLHHRIVIRDTHIVHPYVYLWFVVGFLVTVGGLIGLIRGE